MRPADWSEWCWADMCHDWIFEVLEDLRSYAVQNCLPATAAMADEALRVARAEVAQEEAGIGPAGGAPKGRPN